MPTLLKYFNTDFKCLSLDRTIKLTLQKLDNDKKIIEQEIIEVQEKVCQNMESSSRLFTYYIPEVPNVLRIIVSILNDIEKRIDEAEKICTICSFNGDIQIGEHKNIYSKRVYFYTENPIQSVEMNSLDQFCKAKGLFVTIRSTDYLIRKMEAEKPLAFISHDSRDKDKIAIKLSDGLNSRLCFVWYDEYSLKIGDSLRESIEKGIKEAKKCILIITKNYLNNPGWSKREFSSIFTREMISNERIILPIWYGVTKEEVYDYSPSLADRFALTWPSSEKKSDEEYKKEVEKIISKIHTAITN